jgi:hypothetical protein
VGAAFIEGTNYRAAKPLRDTAVDGHHTSPGTPWDMHMKLSEATVAVAIIFTAAFLALCCSPMAANAAVLQVWFAGLDPISRHAKFPNTPSDYMAMFQPDAPWHRAAAAVQVFELGPRFVTEAPDTTLAQVFADLKRRHIAVAIGASWLPGGDACGKGVEGFMHPGTAESVANRIHRLGGEVQYVVLDEPLYFGHRYDKQNACRWSIAEVARNLATGIAAFQRMFPQAKLCESEPVAIPDAGWIEEIMQWTQAFKSATGSPLACLHADVQWSGPWRQELPALKNRLHAAGVQLGIIYNGDGKAQSGTEWTRQSEERFRMVENGTGLVPDQALLQSWTRQPDHMLPEDKQGTMTWLVNRYVNRGR